MSSRDLSAPKRLLTLARCVLSLPLLFRHTAQFLRLPSSLLQSVAMPSCENLIVLPNAREAPGDGGILLEAIPAPGGTIAISNNTADMHKRHD